jgi:hypothetical protein
MTPNTSNSASYYSNDTLTDTGKHNPYALIQTAGRKRKCRKSRVRKSRHSKKMRKSRKISHTRK